MSHSDGDQAGRRIRIEPTTILPSPAFDVRYPRVRNAELIAPPSLHGMEQSWARGTFPERAIEVFDIPGAYLVDEQIDPALAGVTSADEDETAHA